MLGEYRLAYASDAPVNWCPGLGTVLANEEVTADGRSERGNFPVFKAKLRQWNMRITAYADRLLDDLDALDWPEAIKLQQRNWIGRSEGARVDFPVGDGERITVFTTRPDTLFGATYMVLAPEHPLVDSIVPAAWPEGTHEVWTGGHADPGRGRRRLPRAGRRRSRDVERQAEAKDKTGVFTGAYAINPVSGEQVPVFIADYVLMGYGTGAIMAVPAHDQRDFEFAARLRAADALRRRAVRRPGHGHRPRGTTPSSRTTRRSINSANDEHLAGRPGRRRRPRRASPNGWSEQGIGEGTVNFRLRDWLFSRQRYWGEPFPIVYDEDGVAHALPESMLPLELPEVDDYSPRTFDPDDADTQPGDAAVAQRGLGQRHAGPGRRRAAARTAARPTPCPTGPVPAGTSCATWTRTTARSWSTRRSSSTGWARARASRTAASTCTSAAPSTPCCTCCTRASGPRCCSTWGTSPRSSRSTSCSTRA